MSRSKKKTLHWFSGRDELSGKLETLVSHKPFVTVVGRSGGGKSSLVFAGLFPRLRRQYGRCIWETIVVRPGPWPLRALANNLAFDKTGKFLAAGSDKGYLAVWETSNWKQTRELRNRVGIWSIYGFNPHTGDLAYDGNGGVIRVIQGNSLANDGIKLLPAKIVGARVFLDADVGNKVIVLPN